MDKRSFAPVSAVIPCYRCADTIDRALASVYSQTWRPAEVILVEDCSGDKTLSWLHELKNNYPDGWIQIIALPENGGPGTARNAGWERATQPYIAFLDADDAWHPNKLEIQTAWMQKNPEAALSGHACIIADQAHLESHIHFSSADAHFSPVKPYQLLISNRFPTRSVMLKRSLPYRFVEGKRHSEDFLLWCEICLDGHPCYRSALPLAYLFKAAYGQEGLSGNLWEMQKGQMDSYIQLYCNGRTSQFTHALLLLWSLARFVRRFLIAQIGIEK